MNIKEVVKTEEGFIIRCIFCITAIANKTFKRKSKFFISKNERKKIINYFRCVTKRMKGVSLAGVAICTNFI